MGTVLIELWQDITKCHWIYLATNEAIQKLERREELEDRIKVFLSLVPNGRKFYLKETGEVLKKSIEEVNHFNAQNAMNAFESISQYANNLFTRPWRKEFKTLKMSSGYYQHGIKSNLLYADRLFEAMGYRRSSEDTLILDGPICPSQVADVSLDAMVAYMELQIIKHIHTVLDANGINASWLDILRYRENNTDGVLSAIRALTHAIEEKRYYRENVDYDISDLLEASSNSEICPVHCQCRGYLQFPPLIKRGQPKRHGFEHCWLT